MAYLDEGGLSHLWLLIKQWIINQGFAKSSDIPEGAEASTSTPLMDGTASVGESNKFARGDHRHPSDTTKQNLINSSNKLSADFIQDGNTNKAYTATEKTKLSNIASGAEVNIVKSVDNTAGTSGINLSLSSAGVLDVTISSGSVASGNSDFVTGGVVHTAIQNSISGITGISFEIVTGNLPASGQTGVIYLKSNSGSGQNIYDEYIWVNNGFEKIGTTDVDLSGYLQTTSKISNDDIDDIIV